jgi:hypothetical protein
MKPITAGEELGIDYALIMERSRTPQILLQYACYCGASNCSGTMLAERRKRRASRLSATVTTDSVADRSPATQTTVRIFERQGPNALIVSCRYTIANKVEAAYH